ncbi:hypothetical protein [Kribbella sindirgiensis]|uniref:Tape measure protein n=1 Tax=Kribbella sindirgiensis TaxID=1124744 RepID=A0A4R0I259_9ACTN|nr:hypothetical protein [Kribbella sindirgiensis]TCC19964.1 hypothetical protein E0H50_37705 [Kribbella sindirgiensis]
MTQVVGRIAVKVIPDTSGFRRKLKTDLNAIEKSLDGLKVNLDLDSDGIAQKAKATAKKVQAELDSITLKINDQSQDSLRKAMANIEREIAKLDEIDFKVELDRDSLNAARDLLSEQLDKVSTIDFRVNRGSLSSVEKAISKIDAELEKMAEIDLRIKLDKNSLTTAREVLQAELEKASRIEVQLDNAAFRKTQERIQRELAGIRISPTLDASAQTKLRRQMSKVLGQIDDLQASITPEMSERDRHKVEGDIQDLREKLDDLKKTEIQPELSRGQKLLVAGELRILTRPREVSILPKVSKTAAAKVATTLAALSGARLVNDMIEDLARSLGNLDKNLPIIGTIAEAIAGVGAWALSATSNLFALSASLAQIAGVALVLPGIFGGLAIGLGTTIAVLKDFNTVLPDVKTKLASLQDQMSERFWKVAQKPIRDLIDHLFPELSKGLEETSSNLGTFFGGLATALKTSFDGLLGNMFKDLNNSILIAEGATNAIASAIATLGKVGAGYLPQLAAWFVKIANQFNAWLTQAAADGRLKQWIDDGIFALKELARVAGGIGSILSGIAEAAQKAGGSSLTSLADALGRVAETVNSPSFQQALTGVFEAAQQAMDNISNVAGPSLERFFLSLSGTLQTILPLVGNTIGKVVGAIADALSSPVVSKGIELLFRGLDAGINGILPALAPLSRALGGVATLIGRMAQAIGPVLGQAFTILADLVANLTGPLGFLAETLAGVLSKALTAVAPIIGALAQGLISMAPGINAVVESLGTFLVGALTTLGPLLGQLLETLGQLLGAYLQGMAPVIDVLGQAILQLVEPIAQLVQGFLSAVQVVIPLLPALGELNAAVLQLVLAFLPLVTTILQEFADLSAKVAPAIAPAIPMIAEIVEWLTKFILKLVEFIAPIVQFGAMMIRTFAAIDLAILGFVFKAIASLVTLFTQMVSLAISAGKGFVGAIKGAYDKVTGFFSTLAGVVAGHLAKFVLAVKTKIGEAVTAVQELPGKVKAAVGNMGTALVAAGASVIDGFIAGIKSKIPGVQGVLNGITSNLPSWKGPPEKDSKILTPAGQKVINGFIVGIKSKIPELRGALQSLTNALPSMVKTNIGKVNSVIGSMSKVLTSSQKAHLNALVTQAQTGVALVEKAQAKLTAQIKSAQKNLDDLKKQSADYVKNVYDKLVSPGDITSGEDHSYKAIIANLTKATKQAGEFRKVLAELTKRGLNKEALDQIAQAGPEAGLAAAKSILGQGKAGVKQINALQAQLSQAANKAAQQAAASQFQNGINIAQGLLDGLKKMQKPLDAQMTRLADVLVAAIKRALKIKSPSRVFMKLGGYVGQGFAIGIDNERASVQSSLSAMADHQAVGSKLSGAVNAALAKGGSTSGGKTLNYYAAPGRSLDAEEDLFAAADRTRMVF